MDEQAAPPQGKNNMLLIGMVVLIVIVVLGLVAVFAKPKTASAPATSQTTQVSPTPEGVNVQVTQETKQSEGKMTESQTKTFTVKGKNFSFTPNTLSVKKGDTVKITFMNEDGFHNFMLDEFSVAAKTIPAGQQDEVAFVANKAGTFEYYCSVGTHRQQGMVGKLIVQ